MTCTAAQHHTIQRLNDKKKKKEKKSPSRIRNSCGYIERVWVFGTRILKYSGREKTQKWVKAYVAKWITMSVKPFRSPMAFTARRMNARYNHKSRVTEIKMEAHYKGLFAKRRHLARQFIFIVRVLILLNSRIAVKPTRPAFISDIIQDCDMPR